MSNLLHAVFRHSLSRNVKKLSHLKVNDCLLRTSRPMIVSNRCISKSEKKKDDMQSYVPGLMEKQPKGPETAKEFADVESQKNWISYGFDFGDYKEDRYLFRLFMFIGVTLWMVGGAYIFMYLPDTRLNDWVMREAFLELHRRQKEGLPLVDKNLFDPSIIELPPEEDLSDVDVHI